MTTDFNRLALGITSVDINVSPGTRHVALPSDLYSITVYCNEGFACSGEGEDFQPEVLVTALRTKPGRFLSSGRGELVLAFLTPEAIIRALRVPLSGFENQRIPLERLCGGSAQRQLRHQLMAASTRTDRLLRLGRWIESRVTSKYDIGPGQARVVRATNMMLRETGEFDVGRLALNVGVTRRQMERDFQQWLGTSPAHYARLIRFQRAAAAITRGTPILEAALDHGYADQSHLTRSTRVLAGSTPGALQRASHRDGHLFVRAAMANRLLISDWEDVIFGATGPQRPQAGPTEHALVVRPSAHQQ